MKDEQPLTKSEAIFTIDKSAPIPYNDRASKKGGAHVHQGLHPRLEAGRSLLHRVGQLRPKAGT
mgnify:CR=1 FL=1